MEYIKQNDKKVIIKEEDHKQQNKIIVKQCFELKMTILTFFTYFSILGMAYLADVYIINNCGIAANNYYYCYNTYIFAMNLLIFIIFCYTLIKQFLHIVFAYKKIHY